MSNIINADNGVVSGIAGVKLSSDSTGVLDIQTNGTTAITISTAQVVSLTNSPTFTGGTANGVLYLNASKVATSGSALTFDGTDFATTGGVRLNNSQYYYGKNAAGTAVRLLGVNSGNVNYVGSIDSGPTEVNYGAASTITTQYWNISGAESMRLNATGLGIGTASPGVALDVQKTSAAAYVAQSITNGSSTGYVQQAFKIGANGANGYAGIFYAPTIFLKIGVVTNDTTTPITFVNNNDTERARIPAAGGFQCVNSISVGNATPTTSGAGITFPATQSASSDANTLDDYEEGSWTPVLTSTGTAPTGVSYSFRGGWYRKIGSMVVAGFGFSLSSKGTGATGNIRITGLPFTGAYYGSYQEPAVAMNSGIWNTADIAGKSYLYNPDSTSNLEGRYQNNADTNIAYTEVTNSTYMNCVITYYV